MSEPIDPSLAKLALMLGQLIGYFEREGLSEKEIMEFIHERCTTRLHQLKEMLGQPPRGSQN